MTTEADKQISQRSHIRNFKYIYNILLKNHSYLYIFSHLFQVAINFKYFLHNVVLDENLLAYEIQNIFIRMQNIDTSGVSRMSFGM